MPKTHCAASELTSILNGSTAGELIPALARHGPQQLIELEVAAVIGADRHEQTEERLGYRNGYRSLGLTTQVGDIDLPISIDRRSSACDSCEPPASCPQFSNPVAEWIRPSTP
jgi:putative transposase